MAAPLLQTDIEIDAPVDQVWKLVSDFSQMPRWSPQCRWMKALGPLRAGTRTINLNRRGPVFWPTTAVITEVVPNQKVAFKIPINRTVWSYELEPISNGGGTRLVESRHAENGVAAFPNLLAKVFLGGMDVYDHELTDGMKSSLRNIKAAAEAS